MSAQVFPSSSGSARAWLVEWPQDDNVPARWWNPSTGWMRDANKALWFVRESDAADYIAAGHWVAGIKPTEHVFVGTGHAAQGWANVQLQARKIGQGEWTDIFPAQVQWMSKEGYELRASDLPSPPAALPAGEAVDLIDVRLADLREANDVFRGMDWDKSSEIRRNDREIRWLIDFRTLLHPTSLVSSTHQLPGAAMAEPTTVAANAYDGGGARPNRELDSPDRGQNYPDPADRWEGWPEVRHPATGNWAENWEGACRQIESSK